MLSFLYPPERFILPSFQLDLILTQRIHHPCGMAAAYGLQTTRAGLVLHVPDPFYVLI
jgi:hypothetical protein